MQTSPASIGIVGAGRVGQALGRLLYLHEAPIVAVASRHQAHAEQAAAFIGPGVEAVACSRLPDVATRVLIAVSDEQITEVAQTLASAGMTAGIALHTCGSHGPEILAPLQAAGVACGLLHPLQTISTPEQGVAALSGTTFGVTADLAALAWAEDIVSRLGGSTLRIDSARLPYYHAAAVMASNGLFALVDAAVFLMNRAGVEPQQALEALGPLCRTSLDNTLRAGPAAVLTGPIARGDAVTVKRHLDALRDTPHRLAPLYTAIGRCLLDVASRRGLSQAQIRAIDAMLTDDGLERS